MGCHLDLGFAQEPESIHSQMIYAGSFERVPYLSDGVWPNPTAGSFGNVSLDCTTTFHGNCSLKLENLDGLRRVGTANRGLGNTGLYLQAGKEYQGYFFVLSPSASTLEVTLEALPRGTALDSNIITLQGSTEWQRVNVSLVPNASSLCYEVGLTVLRLQSMFWNSTALFVGLPK
jgi:hypothetical protein